MGSSENNRNPFRVPYYSYRDCSIGQCTVYCPQFCYLAFPPPPQDDDGSNPSSSPFSPLIIATLVVLSGVFLLVSYYLIVTRYCKSRATRMSLEQAETHNNANGLQSSQSGLDKTLIRAIAVRRYRKGDGSIEGTECAVCLSEFVEDEPLRLLPKCSHAFHLPCIDSWLESHSNCPLCRARVVVLPHNDENSEAVVVSFNNTDAYESRRRAGDDLVLVVNDDREDGANEHHHVALSVDCVVKECTEDNDAADDVNVKKSLVLDNHNWVEEERGVSEENVRNEGLECASKLERSASLGAIRSETVKIPLVCEDGECDFGIGCSKGSMRMNRSVSTGR